MKSAWLYIVVVSFAVGVLVASFFAISLEVIFTCISVSFGLAMLWRIFNKNSLQTVSVVCLCVALGMVRFEMVEKISDAQNIQQHVETKIVLTGVVVRDPDQRESTTHLYVDVGTINNQSVAGRVLLYAPRLSAAHYGDRIAAEGVLRVPESFETDLGRIFNYPGYLHVSGVDVVMFYPQISVMSRGAGNKFIDFLLQLKSNFQTSIQSAIPEPQAGLGEGLLLGVKSAMGSELETVFRRTGIIHIVVLSGYNVMLVVVFVMTLLSYVCSMRYRVVFGVLAIISFGLMVGLSATVLRACAMAVLLLIAQATGRIYLVLRALFAVGFLMIVWNPYLLAFDPGFQLSFLATFGLIVLAPYIEQKVRFVPVVFGVRTFLVATLATQIFVLPFLLYQIGELSLVAVIVNVLVLPMVPVAMLLTFITGVLGFVSSTAALMVGFVAYLSLQYILVVATWFAALPFAAYAVPTFPWWVMVLGYVGIGVSLWGYIMRVSNPKNEPLAGWTIEEEKDGVLSADKTPPPKLPYYFH